MKTKKHVCIDFFSFEMYGRFEYYCSTYTTFRSTLYSMYFNVHAHTEIVPEVNEFYLNSYTHMRYNFEFQNFKCTKVI